MAATLGVATLETQVSLDGLKSGLDDAKGQTDGWFRDLAGNSTAALGGAVVGAAAAAVAAVGAIGVAAFGVSNDVATATANIQAELGTTAEEAQRLGDIATDVWGNNFAGSITEAAGAVGIIRQQLGDMADDELQRATENAFRLQDVFGVEVPESVDAAKTLMEQFGLTSEEAFGFITAGFQNGLNRSGDFLDSIGEYSVQFAEGGADAGQFFALMETGMEGGMLGTDKAADLFKEFRVRIQDGSDATIGALEMIGLSSEEMAAQMADGSLSAIDAFQMVKNAIANTGDENVQFQAGVALMGSQFEDLGQAGVLGLEFIDTALEDVIASTDSLDAKYNTLGSAVEGYKRRALLALQPIGDVLLNVANSAMPLVNQAFAVFETTIAPAIETVAGVVQSFFNNLQEGMSPLDAFIEAIWDIAPTEVLDALVRLRDEILPGLVEWFRTTIQPIIDTAAQFVSFQDVLIVAAGALAAVVLPILGSLIASVVAVAAPIVAAIAVVALLRTAWEENWGGIQEKTQAALEFIQSIINTVMTGIQTFWAAHGETIMAAAQTAWEFIQTHIDTTLSVINSVWQAFKAAFEGDWTGFGENLRAAWDTAWEYIKSVFTSAKDTILGIAAGLILDLIAKFQSTDWGQVGRNIIQGIANGITAATGAIADAARAAAQAALDAAKAFLGIESPSKVAAALIGEPFTEGVAVGIGNITPLLEATRQMASEGMISPLRQAVVQDSRQFTWNVHTAGFNPETSGRAAAAFATGGI